MTGMYIRTDPHPDFFAPVPFTSHGTFEMTGCVPKIAFWFSIEDVRGFPPACDWPLATGIADKLLDAGVDARFVLSEIIKYAIPSSVFGRAFERANQNLARQLLARLKRHRRDDKGATWLDEYIDAARQARNRLAAHQLLNDFE